MHKNDFFNIFDFNAILTNMMEYRILKITTLYIIY